MKNPGFTLIELMIVVAIIAIIAAIAIPNLLRSQIGANEASAISTLRTIVTAEAQFKTAAISLSGTVPQYGTLTELYNNVPQFVDAVLGGSNTAQKSGYDFVIALSANTIAPAYTVSANATSFRTGSRNFFIDESGVLTWVPRSDGLADSTSPPLQ